ncbi:MAG: UDP-N-acetylmuramoyl-L-alanyl-D-glutamate--2,6-diaminopimelate ligase [Oscillospiraceae bacterium]|nr:UDP-N-acetylmuramoyl-L-alanyl-D-glutamate--2,6-diaminopimelate ligase [Oscillospiraceae bacterium]
MLLSSLLKNTSAVYSGEDTDISFLTDDTRKVEKGCLFACIKGTRFDGETAAEEMLRKGAAAVLCAHDLGLGDKQILCDDVRETYGIMVAHSHGDPQEKLHLIGITGTNGKTTTATLIHHILSETGHKCGFIGTTAVLSGSEPMDRDDRTPTTPAVSELYEIFGKMAMDGCEYCVMEVSSFALDQNRIGPAVFDVSAFTNLTQDHLDYHGDMESYFLAKRKLFFKERSREAVINCDDPYGKRLCSEDLCPVTSFGKDKGDACFESRGFEGGVMRFGYKDSTGTYPFELAMIGEYNVSNCTAAICICRRLGLDIKDIQAAVKSFRGVRGRCEIIPTPGLDCTVICDYAHSPDAVENVLSSIKECSSDRLVCLFGCGGDRDATKRPKMAAAAARFADRIIVTSDNPRSEDPDAIIDDILKGFPEGTVFDRITDRKKAIFHALATARKGDIIVLAGKGHEDYQILAGGLHIHFDEPEIVREYLNRSYESMTLSEMAEVTGGRIVNGGEDISLPAARISSDTRKLSYGDLFIALNGENFRGADFIPAAMEKGACAAVSDRENGSLPTLLVPDTGKALAAIAAHYRSRYDIPLLGVTGSVGKTTCKDMIAAALSSSKETLSTQGNLNNEVGMPFTLFGLKKTSEAAVIEMGMSAFGEMHRLSCTSKPNICVITNIGWSHAGNLGGREGILKAKLEILDGASENAPVITSDDDMLRGLRGDERLKGHELIVCGLSEDADVRAVNIVRGERTEFDMECGGRITAHLSLSAPGDHHIVDALIAMTAAEKAGCDLEKAAAAIGEFMPRGLRQHIEEYRGTKLLIDCYNAAPASMKAALSVLDSLPRPNAAVLGDMLELGEFSEMLHRRVGGYAAETADMLITVGKEAGYIADEFSRLTDKKVISCKDTDEAAEAVRAAVDEGVKSVLFKASRGMRFEKIVEKLRS